MKGLIMMLLQTPSHEEVYQKLTGLIADKTDIDRSCIYFDSTLNELGFDSLDTYDLILGAEDYYKIKIPNSKIDVTTVSDVTALVHQFVKEKKQ